jgi:hypothetical protein
MIIEPTIDPITNKQSPYQPEEPVRDDIGSIQRTSSSKSHNLKIEIISRIGNDLLLIIRQLGTE